ncbi:MAG: VCBS repeat-containing protein [Planctomycetota bacterium]
MEALAVREVFAADLDGDGDLDALSASQWDNTVAWHENVDGLGGFGARREISTAGLGARSVFAADLDGDADQDVLAASSYDGRVLWFENLGAGAFGPAQEISGSSLGAASVRSADLDGDGDQDVVAASEEDHTIAWFENLGGAFGREQPLSTAALGASAVEAGDVDGDGDLDVVSGSFLDGAIRWYANTDGAGSFAPGTALPGSAPDVRAVALADLDGDGDLDVAAALRADDEVRWYPNLGGGAFGAAQTLGDEAYSAFSVVSGDLDGDGDLDVAAASQTDDTVAWYENVGGGSFAPETVLFEGVGPSDLCRPVDLDGDGDLDVVNITHRADEWQEAAVRWYENLDGDGNFGPSVILSSDVSFVRDLRAADLDGDGDPDAVCADSADGALRWYENLDGCATFGEGVFVDSIASCMSSFPVDLDADGDLDLVSSGVSDERIYRHENHSSLGDFGPGIPVNEAPFSPVELLAGDLNGDGAADIYASSLAGSRLSWFESTGALGGVWPEHPVAPFDTPLSIGLADLDGDGDTDLVAASQNDRKASWFENGDGLGSFGPEILIGADSVYYSSLDVADLDGNGHADVLIGQGGQGLGSALWYPGLGGGAFGGSEVIAGYTQEILSLAAGDFDADGDADVVLSEYSRNRVHWRANCGCPSQQPVEALRLGSPPNPAALQPGLSGGPVVAGPWEPWIDHGAFVPAATLDLLSVSTGAANVDLGAAGTLLCDPAQLVAWTASTPGLPFALAVPDECGLVGVGLCAQGASLDRSGALQLTNALDLVVGSY